MGYHSTGTNHACTPLAEDERHPCLMPRIDSTGPLSLLLLHRLRPRSSPSTSPPSPFWSPIVAFPAATERLRAGTLGPEDAHHLFDELLRQANPAPLRILNTFFAALARAPASAACRDGPALAVALFNRVRREEGSTRVAPFSVHTYSILMDCCCRARRPDLGLAIFGQLLRIGLKIDKITGITFLKCLCCASQTDEALDVLLHRMPQLGCSSNLVAYSTVIHGFCTEGKVSKACNLFHEMVRQGIVPDVVTYTSIIDALCKARAMDKAQLVLSQMVDNGVQPDEVTYNTMIHGYSSLGRWKEAGEMRSRGLIPNISTSTR
uniref:Uncharacterized protein n=1 Tax=Avena sativa TaxID=4498 RepID=A0ACD5ZPD8_AVESA